MAESEMFTLRIPSALVKQVDEFWHTQTLRSRTAAMIHLIRDGLRAQLLLERHGDSLTPVTVAPPRSADEAAALDSFTYMAACCMASGPPERELLEHIKAVTHPPEDAWDDFIDELVDMWGPAHMRSVL